MREHAAAPTSHPIRGIRARRILVACVVAVLAFSSPAVALLEIVVTDSMITEQVAHPDATDPGPILYDTTDGITFSSGLTDIETVWYAEVVSATNNTSASSATVQGDLHAFSDWYHGKQGSAARFGSFNATGTYDPAAADYSVPLLFTKSSQGALMIVSYSAVDPANDRKETTYYWAYDAGANRYVIGPTKNLSSATQLAPISDLLGTDYAHTLDSNSYVVTSVGSAPDYLPVIMQGVHFPLLSLPGAVTWYVLMDPPAGVHADTYTYEVQVTSQGLQ